MKIFRTGLVGCGAIAHLRAQAIARNPAFQLIATADSDASRSTAFAAKYGASSERDWAAMLRRDDLDVIIISTPPSSHAEIAIAALQSGKHVLCEKPLARSTEECQRMIEAAQSSGRTLSTGFNFRFYPSVLKARELFDSGAIGRLDHIRAYTGYSAKTHNLDWLHDVNVMGGGSLRDNGIHLIDVVCYFLGDPVDVQGYATSGVWNFPGCEDNGFALLRNAAGNVATLQASWTEWSGYKFAVEIYGTEGCIRLRCFPMITELIRVGPAADRSERRKFYFAKANLMEHLKSYRWIVVESFIQEFDEFRAAIEGRNTAIASAQDGLRSVEVATRACIGKGDLSPTHYAHAE